MIFENQGNDDGDGGCDEEEEKLEKKENKGVDGCNFVGGEKMEEENKIASNGEEIKSTKIIEIEVDDIPEEYDSEGGFVKINVIKPPPQNTTSTTQQNTKTPAPIVGHRSGAHYKLYGVIVHSGNLFGGHYVNYIKVPKLPKEIEEENAAAAAGGVGGGGVDKKMDGYRWMYCSDQLVRNSSWEEVKLSQAYILFYERCFL